MNSVKETPRITIGEIHTNTIEGRLLMSAIARLTAKYEKDVTPDECLIQIAIVAEEMYDTPLPKSTEIPDFEHALTSVINKYSKENDSNTPDFILAQFLISCLDAFGITSLKRERWYGKNLCIGHMDRDLELIKKAYMEAGSDNNWVERNWEIFKEKNNL